MTAENILKVLESRGITVELQGEQQLGIFPIKALTPELREMITSQKPALIDLLRQLAATAATAATNQTDAEHPSATRLLQTATGAAKRNSPTPTPEKPTRSLVADCSNSVARVKRAVAATCSGSSICSNPDDFIYAVRKASDFDEVIMLLREMRATYGAGWKENLPQTHVWEVLIPMLEEDDGAARQRKYEALALDAYEHREREPRKQ